MRIHVSEKSSRKKCHYLDSARIRRFFTHVQGKIWTVVKTIFWKKPGILPAKEELYDTERTSGY